MIIGRKARWWNRKLSRGVWISFCVALAWIYVWTVYGGACTALAWDITHARTAKFRGQSVKVPWFWKEKEQINYNRLEIGRYGANPLQPSVTIAFENSDPANLAGKINQTKESLKKKANIAVEDYRFDDVLDSKFWCVDLKFPKDTVGLVDCYSRDGLWRVSMVDPSPYKRDLAEILRSVSTMGAPSK